MPGHNSTSAATLPGCSSARHSAEPPPWLHPTIAARSTPKWSSTAIRSDSRQNFTPRGGRPAEAAGVVPNDPARSGQPGQHRFPDPRVTNTGMQQDERRAASAVVCPYLAAVDGDHRLSHEPDYRTPPQPCHEVHLQRGCHWPAGAFPTIAAPDRRCTKNAFFCRPALSTRSDRWPRVGVHSRPARRCHGANLLACAVMTDLGGLPAVKRTLACGLSVYRG
jgi:hypothetical protein